MNNLHVVMCTAPIKNRFLTTAHTTAHTTSCHSADAPQCMHHSTSAMISLSMNGRIGPVQLPSEVSGIDPSFMSCSAALSGSAAA
jgi:hypothetical protein